MDDIVIQLLLKHRAVAQAYFEWLDTRAPRGDVALHERYACAEAEVRASMENHPEFSASGYSAFLAVQMQLSPATQAANLLRHAVQNDPKETLEWYRKAQSAVRADIRVAFEVSGLLLKEPVAFSNGVVLAPLSELSGSAHVRMIDAAHATKIGFSHPSIAYLVVPDVEAIKNGEGAHTAFLARADSIRRTITAFTLSPDNTPTLGIAWAEFVDPDLRATAFGTMWQTRMSDGVPSDVPREIGATVFAEIEKFLALPVEVMSRCAVAISRLNLARRRTTPGDQAIDACICLEALLSDRNPGDLSYKLRLRMARLLAENYDERIGISTAVRKLYELRSSVVHGSARPFGPSDWAIASSGLELALSAIRNIVAAGRIPDFNALELGTLDNKPAAKTMV